MIEKAANIGCRIDVSELPTWWKDNVKHQGTKIPLRCKTCDFDSLQVINNVFKGHRMNCTCNRRVPWSSQRGRDELLLILKQKRLKLTGFDLLPSLTAKTLLQVRCLDCNVVGEISVNHLCKWSLKCFCNRGIDYKDERWRTRLLSIFDEERHLLPTGPVLSKESWTQFQPNKHSKISFRCTRCSSDVEVSIVKFWFECSRGVCLCLWKTQRLVTEFVKEAGGCEVKSEFVISEKLARMPFDIALLKSGECACLIEVDGSQHFSYNKNRMFSQSDVERTRSNDLRKEAVAYEMNCSVVRIVQEDVWKGKFDWKRWLSSAIEFALMSPPKLVVQSPQLYGRGCGVPGFENS